MGDGVVAWFDGAALVACGLFAFYLDVLYLRRPVRPPHPDDWYR